METNRLKQFCTLFETGSMTEAAGLLGISVSGLHKSIKTLEEELGCSLTRTKGRGIELSEEALKLYPKALEILALTMALTHSSQPAKTEAIRIGGLEVFSFILPHFLSQDDFFSQSGVEIIESAPGDIEAQVAQGQLDFGLTYIPVPHPEVNHLKLGDFQMFVFALNSQFIKMNFNDVPFVVPKSIIKDNPRDIKSRDGWKNSLVQRNEKYKTNSLGIALEFVKAQRAAIYLPHFYGAFIGKKATVLDFPNAKKQKDQRQVFLILRKSQDENVMAKKMAVLVRRILKVQ